MNQRIPIMYDRALRPEWLDFALDNYLRATDEPTYRQTLVEHLRPQILGVEALRKTVDQLQRIVGYKSVVSRARLTEIHCQMLTLSPDKRATLRLQLLVEASPFLSDCLEAMKMLAILGVDGVEIKHIYDRLSTRYGDRSIVYRSVRHVLKTLAFHNLASNHDKKWYLLPPP